ncbi:hypothetical protein AGMMS50222_08450 [Endomicrobiia bacterium]|nr:hypothetical protein AGMMS49556_08710 [Endomicrobiia bacterium]GHT76217.1 hypothetical protein AGMMS50222_08450 [Endomicrobiia bacterium]
MMNIVMVESFAQAIFKISKKFEEKMECFNAKCLYLIAILHGINLQLNTKNA